MNELELLRQYEPVVRYTQGEMFFPTAVDEFVKGAGLWLVDAAGQIKLLVAPGDLTLESLAEYDEAPADHTLFLSYAGESLAPMEYQRWMRRADKEPFKASGRLARVSLLSRIGD